MLAAALLVLRLARPRWFARLVAGPVRNRWRWWCCRRRWRAVMTLTGPGARLSGPGADTGTGPVTAGPCADRVALRLVSGQSPKHFADRAEELAHGFGAYTCRVRAATPGSVVLELVRRDALADPIPALAIPQAAEVDLRALPVGRREDGSVFTLRLAGTHLLIAGATGAGKAQPASIDRG